MSLPFSLGIERVDETPVLVALLFTFAVFAKLLVKLVTLQQACTNSECHRADDLEPGPDVEVV